MLKINTPFTEGKCQSKLITQLWKERFHIPAARSIEQHIIPITPHIFTQPSYLCLSLFSLHFKNLLARTSCFVSEYKKTEGGDDGGRMNKKRINS